MKTLRDAVEKFTNEKTNSLSTISQCKRLDQVLGHMRLDRVGRVPVSEYRDARLREASAATVTRELAILHRILNLSVNEWGWIKLNPMAGVSRPKGMTSRDRWLTPWDEVRLLNECPEYIRRLVAFDLETGLRLGEITALTWEHVHLEDDKREYVVVDRSKNGDRRGIPLNKKALDILENIRLVNSAVRGQIVSKVFLRPDGVALTSGHVQYVFSWAAKRAGVSDFHFHDLRHTFATRLAQGGVDLYQVQRLLGHRSASMTQRYAHHSVDSLRGAVVQLGERRGYE